MVGVICKRDVLRHPDVIVRAFGWRVLFRVLAARRTQTFLSIVMEAGYLAPPDSRSFEILHRCVALELAAKQIYEVLGQRFREWRLVENFFQTLAHQEQEHADLLELCRAEAGRRGWDGKHFDLWRESIPRLERLFREAQSKLRAVKQVPDAFWLVLELEASEINQMLPSVVASCKSEFVHEFRVFQFAVQDHLDYIARSISQFDPDLKPACEKMLWGREQVLAPVA